MGRFVGGFATGGVVIGLIGGGVGYEIGGAVERGKDPAPQVASPATTTTLALNGGLPELPSDTVVTVGPTTAPKPTLPGGFLEFYTESNIGCYGPTKDVVIAEANSAIKDPQTGQVTHSGLKAMALTAPTDEGYRGIDTSGVRAIKFYRDVLTQAGVINQVPDQVSLADSPVGLAFKVGTLCVYWEDRQPIGTGPLSKQ